MKFITQEIKFKLIELLKTRGAYSHSVNNKQHYTRCPYCGDSRNLSHAHLSVKIDVESDAPMVYRCLKCSTSGLVTDTFIEELGLYIDDESKKSLKSYNKKAMKYANLVNLDMEKFEVPLYQEGYNNNIKLNYINNRLGTELTYNDAKNSKILLNLFDFMKFNEIETIDGLSFKMMKNLNDNYVGFLSCNNNCIVFRDITGNQKYRYFKVILNNRNINPDTFYSIPNKISLMYTHDINIHIAEGVFDILSIKNNLVKSTENDYYYAMCGFGGITILKYLLHHGINTGINLHIYSDNDKTNSNHYKYLFNGSYITEWVDSITIHRNQFNGEKDYGVPFDRIIDGSKRIK